MKDKDFSSKFNELIKTDDKIIGYFSAYNDESKNDSYNTGFEMLIKEDKFYFAVNESGLYIVIERGSKDVSSTFYVKSGYYSWEDIKQFKFDNKYNALTIKFSDGKDVLVFIKTIEENVKKYLLTKECEPDINDTEFQKNRKKIEKEKSTNAFVGAILTILLIIVFIIIKTC